MPGQGFDSLKTPLGVETKGLHRKASEANHGTADGVNGRFQTIYLGRVLGYRNPLQGIHAGFDTQSVHQISAGNDWMKCPTQV